jgi:hypothetical protein
VGTHPASGFLSLIFQALELATFRIVATAFRFEDNLVVTLSSAPTRFQKDVGLRGGELNFFAPSLAARTADVIEIKLKPYPTESIAQRRRYVSVN